MLELNTTSEHRYVDASITMSLQYDNISTLLSNIQNLINTYGFVQLIVYVEDYLVKYEFEKGVATRYPDSEDSFQHAEMNRLIGIENYINVVKFTKEIPVNNVDLSVEDQHRHIKHWLETNEQPLYVTLGTGTLHNRQPWEKAFTVKTEEIQGVITAVNIVEGQLRCTVEFTTSLTVKRILETSPHILIGLYARIETRYVKLIRMYVRSLYTYEKTLVTT